MTPASNIETDLVDDMPEFAIPPMSAALSELVKSPEPVALRRPLREFGVFLALSLCLMGILFAALGARKDFSELSPLWLTGVALVWLSSFVAASYLGFVPAKGHLRPRSRNLYQIVGVSSTLLIGIGLLAVQSATSTSMTYPVSVGSVLAHAPTCSLIGIGAGILPGIIALLLMRRFVPVGRLSIGLGLGAAGGSLSGLILHLHCPINEGFHVGLVHGGSLVISALLVAAASQVLLRER